MSRRSDRCHGSRDRSRSSSEGSTSVTANDHRRRARRRPALGGREQQAAALQVGAHRAHVRAARQLGRQSRHDFRPGLAVVMRAIDVWPEVAAKVGRSSAAYAVPRRAGTLRPRRGSGAGRSGCPGSRRRSTSAHGRARPGSRRWSPRPDDGPGRASMGERPESPERHGRIARRLVHSGDGGCFRMRDGEIGTQFGPRHAAVAGPHHVLIAGQAARACAPRREGERQVERGAQLERTGPARARC